MRGFFQNLGYKFQTFMQGRNGMDELNRTLNTVVIVFLLVSIFDKTKITFLVALILEVVILFRMFSTNIYKRQKANGAFLRMSSGITSTFRMYKNMFKDRKEYKFYKCPYCKSFVRIRKPPKGKNIAITCHKCRTEFNKRT